MLRPFRNLLLLALLVGGSLPCVRAQDTGWLFVQTNEPRAHVYIDSVYAGPADAGVFTVSSGEAHVRLLPALHDSWSMEAVEQSVVVPAGDTVRVSLPLPYYYRIESVPYGAAVYVEAAEGRQWMGETPLTFRVDDPLQQMIHVDKTGYLAATITPGTDRWNRHVATLDRSMRGGPNVADAVVDWSPPRARPSRWIDYTALGVAVVSGIVAVHYKFKADDVYARYEETGDPMLEDRIRTFDLRSGIALGTMQVGLGVFAIRLALR